MIAFTSAEILQMARDIELDGAAFYRKAAADCDDSDLAGLLLRLAEMEDQHERTFADMAGQLAGAQRGGLFDPDNEARLFLAAMTEGKVVDTTAAVCGGSGASQTAEGILRKALELEESSILFYLGMKRSAADERTRQSVEQIIGEEMDHVSLLHGELSKVQ